MTPEILQIEIINPSGVFLKSKSANIVVRNQQLSMRRYFLQKKNQQKTRSEKKVMVPYKKIRFFLYDPIYPGNSPLSDLNSLSGRPSGGHIFFDFWCFSSL